MIKKITFLLILLTGLFVYSQSSPVNFQSDVTVGVNWINATGIDVSIVDVNDATIGGPTPVITSGAPSGMVGKLITDSGANPWQEAHLKMTTSAIDLTTATGGAKTVTVDVYSTTGNDFLLKVIDPVGGGGAFSQVSAAHNGTGWEQLIFNFNNATNSAVPNSEFKTFVFFPLYDHATVSFVAAANTTTAIDNIIFVEGSAILPTCSDGIQNQDETDIDCGGSICSACPAIPLVAAPTPPVRAPADVKSIFSDAYTSILPSWAYDSNGGTNKDTYDTGWCAADTEPILIVGNVTNQINSLGCEGIDFQGAQLDLTQFTHLHIDVWTETPTLSKNLTIKLSNWNGLIGEESAIEYNVIHLTGPPNGTSLPEPNPGTWISLDLPLADFTIAGGGSLDRDNITEIILAGNLGPIFYDNLYFYRNPPTCNDGIQNQGETGIDCGGPCTTCGTCSDGIQNGGEAGIDCGGPNCAPCTGPPTVAAPTPPARAPGDVISIFSDAYTDTTIDNFDFGLCDGGTPNLAVSEVMIAGNPTQQWLKAGCQGIDIQNNRRDASTFTHLHFDFYTDNAIVGAVFNLKLVDWAGNPTEAGSTGLEVIFNGGTATPLVANQWVSVDVNITSLGGMVLGNLTRSDVAQIHITSNLPNAWYDNLYLHKNTVLSTEDFDKTSFSAYPNPTKDSWTVKTKNVKISSVQVYDILGKNVLSLSPNANEVKIDATNLKTGLYFVKISSENGSKSLKLIKE